MDEPFEKALPRLTVCVALFLLRLKLLLPEDEAEDLHSLYAFLITASISLTMGEDAAAALLDSPMIVVSSSRVDLETA